MFTASNNTLKISQWPGPSSFVYSGETQQRHTRVRVQTTTGKFRIRVLHRLTVHFNQ